MFNHHPSSYKSHTPVVMSLRNGTSRTSPNGPHPDTIQPIQIRKAVCHPIVPMDGRVVLSSDMMRGVFPNITRPGHDLDTSTSVIVALETCLCPKSYLIGYWIRLTQVRFSVRWVDGCGASNSMRRLAMHHTFGVTYQQRTKVCSTGSILGQRHLEDSV